MLAPDRAGLPAGQGARPARPDGASVTAMRAWLLTLAAALVLAATGCPRHTRRTLVPPAPTDGDAAARQRFADARAAFARDGDNAAEFVAIGEQFPDDPIAPWAHLYAGIAHVAAGAYAEAVRELDQVDDGEAPPGLRTRADLFLGLARNYQGEHGKALPRLARGEAAIEGDAERAEWLAAMAVATAAGSEPLAALRYFDRWYPLATSAERGYILARVGELVAAAPAEGLRSAWAEVEPGRGPAAALLGPRLAGALDEQGDAAGAARVRAAAAPARAALGLPASAPVVVAAGGGEPGLVAALLPTTGKGARVGELSAQALAVAGGAVGGAALTTIDVHAADSAEAAAAAVDAAAAAGVVAAIGPIDGAAVDAATARAEALGLPLLSLSPRPEERAAGRTVFHLWHSAEMRARALARAALAGGARRFALAVPESGYGRAVRAAFEAEVGAGGGTVVVARAYPVDARSFAGVAKQLSGAFDAVFIGDAADRLELIAPALAAAGLVPRPGGKGKVALGRAVWLLSTAENVAPDFLVDAGRHALGALLAPGFYADAEDPVAADFVRVYQAAHGRAPVAVDAYAYDAALLAARAGGGGRAGLVRALAAGEVVGLTGPIRFDRDHRRADDGVLYTVEADAAGGLRLRALRP